MGGLSVVGSLVAGICLLFILPCQIIQLTEAANIVIFLGVSSYSMRMPLWPIAEALAERGDNVTFVSPFPSKSPNPKIHDYVPPKLKAWVDSWEGTKHFGNAFEDRKKGTGSMVYLMFPDLGAALCEEIYKDEGYTNWVKSAKVDLLILDSMANECAYGMAHYWGAKVVVSHSCGPFGYHSRSFGLPDESASIPSTELGHTADLSFLQRIYQALLPLAWDYLFEWNNYYSRLREITMEKLGIQDMPTIQELERNTSLVFLNTYYAEEFPRSLPPNVIPIGGIAVTGKTKALPKDLEAFLNKGNGFVYMSFGTFVDFLSMEEARQGAFIDTMKKLKHIQFVWKVGDESLIKEFPHGNVYIGKWMPQQDILAHPKIKAFITHAGLMGTQEAIHFGVPLITFPVYPEQDYNADRIHRRVHGIRLEVTTITQPELEDAINKIVSDPKYRNNMISVSTLFRERPQTPLETAMWWLDFVLRHSQEELAALRPLHMEQTWWQRRQLDVWATVMFFLATIVTALTYVIYKILLCVFCAGSSVKLSEKNRDKKTK